jgi:hypothetical protein
VGSGWKKEFANGGYILNIGIKVADLPAPDQYGRVSLTIGERKTPDEKSKATHWVAIDDYRHPEPGSAPAKEQKSDLQF